MNLLATTNDYLLGSGLTLVNVVLGALVVLAVRHFLHNQPR
jgi:hypothetical protein